MSSILELGASYTPSHSEEPEDSVLLWQTNSLDPQELDAFLSSVQIVADETTPEAGVVGMRNGLHQVGWMYDLETTTPKEHEWNDRAPDIRVDMGVLSVWWTEASFRNGVEKKHRQYPIGRAGRGS